MCSLFQGKEKNMWYWLSGWHEFKAEINRVEHNGHSAIDLDHLSSILHIFPPEHHPRLDQPKK